MFAHWTKLCDLLEEQLWETKKSKEAIQVNGEPMSMPWEVLKRGSKNKQKFLRIKCYKELPLLLPKTGETEDSWVTETELQKHSFNNIYKYSCSFFMNNISAICANIRCLEFVILVAGSWYHSRDTKWQEFLRCKRKKRESGEVINHKHFSQNPYHKVGFLTMINWCKNTFFPHPLCKCDSASLMLLK